MKKVGVICLILLVAMGILGVSYARWSQNLNVAATVTTGAAPAVTTNAVTSVGSTSATLNGSLTGLGAGISPSVNLFFEYGTNTSYGTTVAGTPSFATTVPTAFIAALTGLPSNTLYHFRAKAVGLFTTYGSDLTFTTTSTPTGYSVITPGTITPTPSDYTTITATGVGTMTMNVTINVGDNGHDYTFPVTCTLWNSSGVTKYVDTVTITTNAPVGYTGLTGALGARTHTQINNNTGVAGGISFTTPKCSQGGPYTATVTFTLRNTP